MAPIIDKVLGLRCASFGYQYVMPDGVRGRWVLPIHNHVYSGKAIVRWKGKLQNVVYITICCGF